MAKIYLDTTDRKEALAKFLQEVQPFNRFETIKVADALHRVTAKPIMARLSLPMYPVSAMDGITIIANKSFAASDQNPLLLELDKDYVVVDTGDPLPWSGRRHNTHKSEYYGACRSRAICAPCR